MSGIVPQATRENLADRPAAARRVGLFLVSRFALMSFASVIEAMRAANRCADHQLYEWIMITADGSPAISSSGVEIRADRSISEAGVLDDLFVIASLGAESYRNDQVFAWLRRVDRSGCRVGAVSLGSYILARAGLLEGYRCTVHWENLDGFREEFGNLEVTGEVFEVDRNRFTGSGGTAVLDLMLSLIAMAHGRALAVDVAEQFIHTQIRDSREHQRMTPRARFGVSHPKLLHAIGLMEENGEEVLSRAELARKVGVSSRQLERLFQRHLGCTPTRFYLSLRLERARHLLLQTSMSAMEVALACGFVSASHFAKTYREHFGRTPKQDRADSVA